MYKTVFIICVIFAVAVNVIFAETAHSSDTLSQESSAQYNSFISKADSCFMKGNYTLASEFFDKAFAIGVKPQGNHLYNGACAAAMSGDENAAFCRLFTRLRLYPEWYSNQIQNDRDLSSLHSAEQWRVLCDSLQNRKILIEKNYDHALKARLDSIHSRDQLPRHAYLAALQTVPQDTLLVKKRLRDMQMNDSINQIEVFDILDRYGWPSSGIVGGANFAIWEVIQHTSLEAIEKYLPLFHKAAADNELNKSFVAMMEDRCEMWHNRPQKYGTQGIRDENGVFIPYTLLNPDKVDEWRAEMDLPPLEEYIKQMNSK